MVSSSATTLLTLSPTFPNTNINTFSPKHTLKQLKLTKNNATNIPSLQIQCLSTLASHHSQTQKSHTLSPSLLNVTTTTADKLKHLSSEFNSLSDPIDRVKRLLHYASMLPPLEESDRVPSNRVVGCSTQVWVVSEMDEVGRMRFRADSDSEISKGFCWCLVWMLDGAEPKEVLTVEKEDLTNMNVGLNVKAHSRVNTWQNVLFAMQKATQDLVLEDMPCDHHRHVNSPTCKIF